MSSDDDDTTVIRGGRQAPNRLVAAVSKTLPSVKVWHVLAIAVAAFVAGAWIF